LGLSVVIPVYNEARCIRETILIITKTLEKSEIKDFEIIAVNDGSTDDTTQILNECTLTFRHLEHQHNKGYGASLKTGIKAAQYDIIATTDADGTYPNIDIPKLYAHMKDNDMVVGSRTGKVVHIPWVRKPAKWFINKLANYLTSTKIPDINSGLRLFRKDDCLKFFKILPSGFSFSTTITLAMLTNHMTVKYIPIDYMKRTGKSKIKPIRDTANFIALIVRTILYFNPLKVFVPVSIFLLLASLGIFVYSYLALPKILDATVTTLFIASIQLLAIGMLADLLEKRSK